jgi:hypothetical protein
MARVRHDKDFKIVMQWLRDVRIDLATSAMIMDESRVGRNQGAFMCVEDILNYILDAPGVIEAAHERKKQPKTHIP